MTFIIPDELFAAFIQWVRDFDNQHPDCMINMFGETAQNSAQMRQIFESVKPGFPFIAEWKLKDGDK